MTLAPLLLPLGAMADAEGVRRVPFVLYGVGGVGSELLRSIVRARELHAARYRVRLAAVGVCDSAGAGEDCPGICRCRRSCFEP